VGVITAEDALDLGVSGPALRACGVDWDLRRDHPYSSYEKFSFNVPISTDGDVYARYLLRIAEMRESIKMVQQALDGLPEGPIKATLPGVILPEREKMKTEMEALIYHFKIITEGYRVPAGEVYQAVESPRGEMGYYIVSDGTAKPYRVHMRSACLANLQTLPTMCEGRLLADVVAAIGSIDIVLGENFSKAGVLGEKTIAGVDGVRATALRRIDDPFDAQIAFRRGARADVDGLIGLAHMPRIPIAVGIDRDRRNAHLAAGAHDPDGDLTPVGDEDFHIDGDRKL
jgi:hypothetical protein